MSYTAELQSAIERTAKWKLGTHKQISSSIGLTQEQRNELEAATHVPFEQRPGQAFSVNFGDYHYILKTFGIAEALLTIGNVSLNDRLLYPATSSHLKKILKHKNGEESMDRYHVWTTLPNGHIIDSVIPSALFLEGAADINPLVPTERTIYAAPETLPYGLKYHPLLVGVKFFVASETIDEEAMQYILGEAYPS